MASENTKYLVRRQGGPLEATITPKPTILEPTEVMIRLKAIAVNPADCKMIYQGLRITSWPLVPGMDGAGVVEAVGHDVKRFATGDEVLAMFAPGDRGACFQDLAVVPEMMVAKKPMTWSFEDAATLGCVACFLPSCFGPFSREP
jgi:NADPH:quinone reductase-like Zn-dependent oxidoreductase